MELSTLCGQKISFKMLDPDSHTLVIYNSKDPLQEGDLAVNLEYEIYEDCDYDDLSGKFLKADTMNKIQARKVRNPEAKRHTEDI